MVRLPQRPEDRSSVFVLQRVYFYAYYDKTPMVDPLAEVLDNGWEKGR